MKYTQAFIVLIIVFLISSCWNTALQGELSNVKSELDAAKTTIEKLQTEIEPEGDLVHLVFFKTKPDADLAVLGAEIHKLNEIEGVKDLQFGAFEDLGDDRALTDYTLLMEMSFDDAAAYNKYQTHPIHLQLKEKIKPFMAGPPATYDYQKQ